MAEELIKNIPGCQCRIDAVISVDARGQFVLPKEVREKAGIKEGDKFVLISHDSDGKSCCLFLVKADFFSETVKSTLGPLVQDILK